MDIWRAIDKGERAIDWEAWLGHPEGNDYLTNVGKDLPRRAASDLTAFFGLAGSIRPSSPPGHEGRAFRDSAAHRPYCR